MKREKAAFDAESHRQKDDDRPDGNGQGTGFREGRERQAQAVDVQVARLTVKHGDAHQAKAAAHKVHHQIPGASGQAEPVLAGEDQGAGGDG